MDDKAFLEFVKTNAQRFDTETIEAARKHLTDLIALRRSGRPPGLEVGSNVETIELDTQWHRYGDVTRLTDKACYIRPPGRNYDWRILFSKHAIRLVDASEWHWLEESLLKQNREIDEKIVAEEQERVADREAAVRQRERNAKKATAVRLPSGDEVRIYRGAYIHAYTLVS